MTEKRYLKWYNKVGYGSGDIAGAECSCKFPYLRFPRRISDRLLFFGDEAGRHLEIRLRKELHQCHPRL